jgi:hypothetical protein
MRFVRESARQKLGKILAGWDGSWLETLTKNMKRMKPPTIDMIRYD